jgi:hypothetical protein
VIVEGKVSLPAYNNKEVDVRERKIECVDICLVIGSIPNIMTEWSTLLLRIWEVLVSDVCPENGYAD